MTYIGPVVAKDRGIQPPTGSVHTLHATSEELGGVRIVRICQWRQLEQPGSFDAKHTCRLVIDVLNRLGDLFNRLDRPNALSGHLLATWRPNLSLFQSSRRFRSLLDARSGDS